MDNYKYGFMAILDRLNIPVQGITISAEIEGDLRIVQITGPFSALELVNLFAELEKEYNKPNRIFHFYVNTNKK